MAEHKSLDSLFHLVLAMKRQLHEQAEQSELGIAPMHMRVMKIISLKKPVQRLILPAF